MASWWRSYITQRARRWNLDPQAVLAVAAQEGLGGGVGDRGTSFGPFQLHVGGALPRGRGRAWAESRAGIDYALAQMAHVAAGKRGTEAISAIVSRFERPADPRSEIQGALAAYGHAAPASMGATAPGPLPGPSAPTQPSQPSRSNLLATLIDASQQTGRHEQPDYSPVFSALAGLRPQGGVASPHSSQAMGALSEQGPSPTGGPSLSFLLPFAKRFGLEVTSTTGGQHVSGSYHYQHRAADFGGDPQRMAALQHYALAHPGEFVEVFYTGPGAFPYFVKNGKVLPIARLDAGLRRDHRDHVHLAR